MLPAPPPQSLQGVISKHRGRNKSRAQPMWIQNKIKQANKKEHVCKSLEEAGKKALLDEG